MKTLLLCLLALCGCGRVPDDNPLSLSYRAPIVTNSTTLTNVIWIKSYSIEAGESVRIKGTTVSGTVIHRPTYGPGDGSYTIITSDGRIYQGIDFAALEKTEQ